MRELNKQKSMGRMFQAEAASEKASMCWGTWMAQSVEHQTSAQVMISQFVGSSPMSGSVLTAQSLEPASDSVSLSLCPSPTPAHALSHSVPQK